MGAHDDAKRSDLIIFSNGPGEVSTWVLPVVEAVRSRDDLSQQLRIFLVIHPCQFGSGREASVARRFEGIDAVIGPKEYMRMLFTGVGMKRHGFAKEGIIFSLGGNLMHPVLFRRRIKGRHTLYAYTNNPGWHERFERIFVRSDYVKNKFLGAGFPGDKVLVVGDLVHSSLRHLMTRGAARRNAGVKSGEKLVAFMPGSRPFEVKYMLSVFLKVIEDCAAERKDLKPFILRSPYVPDALLELGLSMGGKFPEAESIPGKLVRRGSAGAASALILLPGGREVPILEGGLEAWGNGIDLAVTLPGTNTVQLAYRGVPSLVISALNKPELIPIEGVAGVVKLIPFFGKRIIRKAVWAYIGKFRFGALPNIYENEEVVPELTGVIETTQITRKVLELLDERRLREVKERLGRFSFAQEPVDLILESVWGGVKKPGTATRAGGLRARGGRTRAVAAREPGRHER